MKHHQVYSKAAIILRLKNKDGLNIIAEAVIMLQYEEYLESEEEERFGLDSLGYDVGESINYFLDHKQDSRNNWTMQ